MTLAYTRSTMSISDILDQLARRARAERLECALPLIGTLHDSFSPATAVPATPSGALTVAAWLALFQHWESALTNMQMRRLPFLRDFFRESMTLLRLNSHAHANAPASLVRALQELLAMIDDMLQADGMSRRETSEKQAVHAA